MAPTRQVVSEGALPDGEGALKDLFARVQSACITVTMRWHHGVAPRCINWMPIGVSINFVWSTHAFQTPRQPHFSVPQPLGPKGSGCPARLHPSDIRRQHRGRRHLASHWAFLAPHTERMRHGRASHHRAGHVGERGGQAAGHAAPSRPPVASHRSAPSRRGGGGAQPGSRRFRSTYRARARSTEEGQNRRAWSIDSSGHGVRPAARGREGDKGCCRGGSAWTVWPCSGERVPENPCLSALDRHPRSS